MCGYFSGLSAPSVTDMITTRADSPRSNSAGHTRLPTFSIRTSPPRGSSLRNAASTIVASRWHPEPVFTWSTGAPGGGDPIGIERGLLITLDDPDRAAIRPARRPSARAASSCPTPGELIRLTAATPRDRSQARLSAASSSFLARIRVSSVNVSVPWAGSLVVRRCRRRGRGRVPGVVVVVVSAMVMAVGRLGMRVDDTVCVRVQLFRRPPHPAAVDDSRARRIRTTAGGTHQRATVTDRMRSSSPARMRTSELPQAQSRIGSSRRTPRRTSRSALGRAARR